MNTIYLDNAASAKPSEKALDVFLNAARLYYANQEAIGGMGKEALHAVQQAGEHIASQLAPGWKTTFVNTATESIEAAIAAFFSMHPGTTAVTTKAEHPALQKALKRHAGKILYVPLEKNGKVRLDVLAETAKDRIFCGIHHVNAETGAIQDCTAIRNAIGSESVFLCDTTQSACKCALPAKAADIMMLSGAKTGAPCAAALLTSPRIKMEKALAMLRSRDHAFGRCVPAAALALDTAITETAKTLEERAHSAGEWKKTVLAELAEIPFTVTVPESSPYILHLLFPGKQGAVLVRLLGSMGVSVSSGSACLSETPDPSAVLQAMGYSRKEAFSALRISLAVNERPDPVRFAALLKKALRNY